LFDLTGGDKYFIDEIALSDRVQKYFESEMTRLSKGGSKSKQGFKNQRQRQSVNAPPKPQFVKEKFWKNKKWDRWS